MGKTRSTGFLNNLLSYDASGNITTTGTISASGGTVSYLPLSGGVLTGELTGTGAIFSDSLAVGAVSASNFKAYINGDVYGATGFYTRNTASTFIGSSNNTSGISVNGSTGVTQIASGGNYVLTLANSGAASFTGSVTANGGFILNTSQTPAIAGSIGYNSAVGVFIHGRVGTEADFRLYNKDGLTAMSILTGTQNVSFSGNVAIGKSSPALALDVVGRIRNTFTSAGTTVLEAYNPSTTGYGAYISGGTSSNYALQIADYANNVRLTVLGGGNVGINDTNPGEKLDVNGNTRIQGTTMIGSNVGLLQLGMDGTRFNSNGFSTAHIKTSILKGADTMIAFNIRGYMYSPNPVDTDVGFYCYAPTSTPYGVTIYHKAYNGWGIGMYYSSDNYVCIYVDGMSTYGGFTLNWINTSLISHGGRVSALAWTKANTTAAQY